MQTVTREQIEETWERLCNLGQEETEAVAKQFMEEQPALGIFVSALIETMEEEDAEESPLINLVIAAWTVMQETAGHPLKMVEPEAIESVEEANGAVLENLAEDSESAWADYTRQLMSGYNQRELLGFGIEVQMSGFEENPEMAPERLGLELLCYKTALDCLDQGDE